MLGLLIFETVAIAVYFVFTGHYFKNGTSIGTFIIVQRMVFRAVIIVFNFRTKLPRQGNK